MSYSIINPSMYSYEQWKVAAKARQRPGLHLVFTNGMRSINSEGDGVPQRIVFQKGLIPGQIVTHVLYYHDTYTLSKHRIAIKGDYKSYSTYFEIYMEYNESHIYCYGPNTPWGELDRKIYTPRPYSPGVAVFEVDVSKEGLLVSENGGQSVPKRLSGDYSLAIQHGCNEAKYCGPTFLELHIAYKSDPSVVFEKNFWTPNEVIISAGGFVMLEGSVDNSGTVSISQQVVYDCRKAKNLQVVMKFYSTKTVITAEGVQDTKPREVPAPYIDYSRALRARQISTTGIMLKNFVMETGLIGVFWPK